MQTIGGELWINIIVSQCLTPIRHWCEPRHRFVVNFTLVRVGRLVLTLLNRCLYQNIREFFSAESVNGLIRQQTYVWRISYTKQCKYFSTRKRKKCLTSVNLVWTITSTWKPHFMLQFELFFQDKAKKWRHQEKIKLSGAKEHCIAQLDRLLPMRQE